MTVKEVMQIAKKNNIKNVKGLKKADMIRNIQVSEGNFQCFGTMEDNFCDQDGCLWIKDCKSTSKNKTSRA